MRVGVQFTLNVTRTVQDHYEHKWNESRASIKRLGRNIGAAANAIAWALATATTSLILFFPVWYLDDFPSDDDGFELASNLTVSLCSLSIA